MDTEYHGPTRKELMYLIWDHNRNHPLRFQIKGVNISDTELEAIKNMHADEKIEFSHRINRFTHGLRELKRSVKSKNEQALWDNLVHYTVTMNKESKRKRKEYMQHMDVKSAKELQAKQPQLASHPQGIRRTQSSSQLQNAGIIAGKQRLQAEHEKPAIQVKVHGGPKLAPPAENLKREPSPRRSPPETAPPKKKPSPQPVAIAVKQQAQIQPQSKFLPQNPKPMVPQVMPRPCPKEEKKEEKKPGRGTIVNQKMVAAHLEAQKLASEVRKFS